MTTAWLADLARDALDGQAVVGSRLWEQVTYGVLSIQQTHGLSLEWLK